MTQRQPMDRRRFLALAGGTAAGAAALSAADLLPAGMRPPGMALSQALAADEPPVGIPFLHGYDAPGIKSWTPQSDPYAKYFRSRVPLATRIATFKPTQANPDLDDRPRLMSLMNDYMEAENFALAHKYGYSFEAYALRFWQYVDMIGSWHGLPVAGEYGKDDPRFGTVNLPNPAWTDAAHRNGVKSLGCWFWPRSEDFNEFVEKRADGSFPLADKLIEMAAYFGFDGYFINQEAAITLDQTNLLHEMFTYLTHTAPAGFHVQWYDALTMAGTVRYQNEFDAVNSPWVLADGVRVCSSIFLNYWFSDAKMQRSHDYALSLGLDPYEVVFAGTEAGQNHFSQPYDPRWIFPEGGEARTSWAFLGAEFPWRIAPGDDRSSVATQAPVYTYERQWWSGPKQDPSRTGRSLPPTGDDNENPEHWDGVAHTIVEKSAVGSYPFVTRFNAGTGLRFFVDGRLVGERPWYNIGIQDVLPTWQWWLRSSDGSPASGLSVDYDYDLAYDGGTSLAVSGSLAAGEAVELRLFKTRLPVTHDAEVALTYTTGHAGVASNLSVGLVFADAPDAVTWVDAGRTHVTDWNHVAVSLAAHSGRTVAAVSLGFRSPGSVDGYSVHVGELRLQRGGDKDLAPSTPDRFTVEEAHINPDGTATVFAAWDLSRHDVWYYDLFRVDGPREWLGRTYDEVYVVPGLKRRGDESRTTLELVAVSRSGVVSKPAQATFPWS